MNLRTFSFSRLLTAGSFISLLTMIVAGCDKDDKQAPPATIPVVATAALTNITSSGATAGGSIVSDGGAAVTASGVVWSKSNATPTLADSVIAGTTSSGTFTTDVTGLDFNTSYYIRAFATNSVGTGYGEVVTLNTTNDTNKVRFTYNGEEVVYGVIVSPTSGRKWLDRNLGAQQVATAFDDYLAYGDLFQWGRPDDGHQLMNWTASNAGTRVNGMTTTLATSDAPGHNDFIDATASSVEDWRSETNNNRWNTSPQGPCPTGWHVPTYEEWGAEFPNTIYGGTATSGGIMDRNTAYSLLKLTSSGMLNGTGTQAGQVAAGSGGSTAGNSGWYWASTDFFYYPEYDFSHGYEIELYELSAQIQYLSKSYGMNVRCIKD